MGNTSTCNDVCDYTNLNPEELMEACSSHSEFQRVTDCNSIMEAKQQEYQKKIKTLQSDFTALEIQHNFYKENYLDPERMANAKLIDCNRWKNKSTKTT